MHIAFVTPEFVTEHATGGGLGNYLNRITQSLRDLGHQVEIFVVSEREAETFDYSGVAVHRVPAGSDQLASRLAWHACRLARGQQQSLRSVLSMYQGAIALGRALARRERSAPFDFVQSSDYLASGLFVRASQQRPHVVRCSQAEELRSAVMGDGSWFTRVHARLRRRTSARGDLCYAPSRFIADHFRSQYGLDMRVVRPPVFMETEPATELEFKLPGRYFLHFGLLRVDKGTQAIAAALPLVWRQAPDFRMLWVGKGNRRSLEEWTSSWGDRRDQVQIVESVPKPTLYGILKRAEATVLPSLIDNLPNTVIESLLFGIPVIGSDGASIDELVEHGRNGTLVPVGDVPALAEALLQAWRGEAAWMEQGFQRPMIFAEMQPAVAAQNLIRLARPDLVPAEAVTAS